MLYEYENHKLENEKLPFIFHYDTMSKGVGDTGNWHENPEFLYILKGHGTINYNKHNYDISAGDTVIINSDCVHAITTDNSIEYYCLIVGLNFFSDNGIPIQSLAFEPIVKKPELYRHFEKTAMLYQEKPEFYYAKIRSEVLSLIISLCDGYLTDSDSIENVPGRITDAIRYIKQNYNKNITVDDIVNHVGFSRAYFSREFKKHTGVSLITYLNYIRCSQARSMLGKSGTSVNEAAEACGFQNLSYFSKTYQKLMGVLPSADMRNFKNGKGDNNSSMLMYRDYVRIE